MTVTLTALFYDIIKLDGRKRFLLAINVLEQNETTTIVYILQPPPVSTQYNITMSAEPYADGMVQSTKDFFTTFYSAFSSGNMQELRHHYFFGFKDQEQKYYKDSPWPDVAAVAPSGRRRHSLWKSLFQAVGALGYRVHSKSIWIFEL